MAFSVWRETHRSDHRWLSIYDWPTDVLVGDGIVLRTVLNPLAEEFNLLTWECGLPERHSRLQFPFDVANQQTFFRLAGHERHTSLATSTQFGERRHVQIG